MSIVTMGGEVNPGDIRRFAFQYETRFIHRLTQINADRFMALTQS